MVTGEGLGSTCDQFSPAHLHIHTQVAYNMFALFVELRTFARYREQYLPDSSYLLLQQELMDNPLAGDVIAGTGGLRKKRFADESRGRGKRGGLRVIYFYLPHPPTFWLFTVYSKAEVSDLSLLERKQLGKMLDAELEARQ